MGCLSCAGPKLGWECSNPTYCTPICGDGLYAVDIVECHKSVSLVQSHVMMETEPMQRVATAIVLDHCLIGSVIAVHRRLVLQSIGVMRDVSTDGVQPRMCVHVMLDGQQRRVPDNSVTFKWDLTTVSIHAVNMAHV